MISGEWILILGMTTLTFVPRYIPMALASRFHIPPLLAEALEFVPIAVLTTIIAQTTLVHNGQVHLSTDNAHLYGAVVALITAQLSKHLFLTIVTGLATYTVAFTMI